MDHPFVNSIGVLLLKVALVWMIVAQLHIDIELYKYSRKIGDLSLMELVHFSEKMFLGGLVVMFIGMFVTITVSSFGGTAAPGVLISLTLIMSLFTNLILLPSVLLSLALRRKRNFLT